MHQAVINCNKTTESTMIVSVWMYVGGKEERIGCQLAIISFERSVEMTYEVAFGSITHCFCIGTRSNFPVAFVF